MLGSEFFHCSSWWIFPVLMIALCFFMMRWRKGSIMCGLGSHRTRIMQMSTSDSAFDILDKRYALGDITKEEYEEKNEFLKQK
jgi:uncharacterized membrane protein